MGEGGRDGVGGRGGVQLVGEREKRREKGREGEWEGKRNVWEGSVGT